MTDRDRLKKIITRAILNLQVQGIPTVGSGGGWIEPSCSDLAEVAIDSAERAGFRWLGPDDGR